MAGARGCGSTSVHSAIRPYALLSAFPFSMFSTLAWTAVDIDLAGVVGAPNIMPPCCGTMIPCLFTHSELARKEVK